MAGNVAAGETSRLLSSVAGPPQPFDSGVTFGPLLRKLENQGIGSLTSEELLAVYRFAKAVVENDGTLVSTNSPAVMGLGYALVAHLRKNPAAFEAALKGKVDAKGIDAVLKSKCRPPATTASLSEIVSINKLAGKPLLLAPKQSDKPVVWIGAKSKPLVTGQFSAYSDVKAPSQTGSPRSVDAKAGSSYSLETTSNILFDSPDKLTADEIYSLHAFAREPLGKDGALNVLRYKIRIALKDHWPQIRAVLEAKKVPAASIAEIEGKVKAGTTPPAAMYGRDAKGQVARALPNAKFIFAQNANLKSLQIPYVAAPGVPKDPGVSKDRVATESLSFAVDPTTGTLVVKTVPSIDHGSGASGLKTIIPGSGSDVATAPKINGGPAVIASNANGSLHDVVAQLEDGDALARRSTPTRYFVPGTGAGPMQPIDRTGWYRLPRSLGIDLPQLRPLPRDPGEDIVAEYREFFRGHDSFDAAKQHAADMIFKSPTFTTHVSPTSPLAWPAPPKDTPDKAKSVEEDLKTKHDAYIVLKAKIEEGNARAKRDGFLIVYDIAYAKLKEFGLKPEITPEALRVQVEQWEKQSPNLPPEAIHTGIRAFLISARSQIETEYARIGAPCPMPQLSDDNTRPNSSWEPGPWVAVFAGAGTKRSLEGLRFAHAGDATPAKWKPDAAVYKDEIVEGPNGFITVKALDATSNRELQDTLDAEWISFRALCSPFAEFKSVVDKYGGKDPKLAQFFISHHLPDSTALFARFKRAEILLKRGELVEYYKEMSHLKPEMDKFAKDLGIFLDEISEVTKNIESFKESVQDIMKYGAILLAAAATDGFSELVLPMLSVGFAADTAAEIVEANLNARSVNQAAILTEAFVLFMRDPSSKFIKTFLKEVAAKYPLLSPLANKAIQNITFTMLHGAAMRAESILINPVPYMEQCIKEVLDEADKNGEKLTPAVLTQRVALRFAGMFAATVGDPKSLKMDAITALIRGSKAFGAASSEPEAARPKIKAAEPEVPVLRVPAAEDGGAIQPSVPLAGPRTNPTAEASGPAHVPPSGNRIKVASLQGVPLNNGVRPPSSGAISENDNSRAPTDPPPAVPQRLAPRFSGVIAENDNGRGPTDPPPAVPQRLVPYQATGDGNYVGGRVEIEPRQKTIGSPRAVRDGGPPAPHRLDRGGVPHERAVNGQPAAAPQAQPQRLPGTPEEWNRAVDEWAKGDLDDQASVPRAAPEGRYDFTHTREIGGKKVPPAPPRRLDIEDVPLRPGETRREAVARVRTIIGTRLSDHPDLARAWEQARATVLRNNSPIESNDPLVNQIRKTDLDNKTQTLFWRVLGRDPTARKKFADAGFDLPGRGAPARLSGVNRAISGMEKLVRVVPVDAGQGGERIATLNPDNLRFDFSQPDAERAAIQYRHGGAPPTADKHVEAPAPKAERDGIGTTTTSKPPVEPTPGTAATEAAVTAAAQKKKIEAVVETKQDGKKGASVRAPVAHEDIETAPNTERVPGAARDSAAPPSTKPHAIDRSVDTLRDSSPAGQKVRPRHVIRLSEDLDYDFWVDPKDADKTYVIGHGGWDELAGLDREKAVELILAHALPGKQLVFVSCELATEAPIPETNPALKMMSIPSAVAGTGKFPSVIAYTTTLVVPHRDQGPYKKGAIVPIRPRPDVKIEVKDALAEPRPNPVPKGKAISELEGNRYVVHDESLIACVTEDELGIRDILDEPGTGRSFKVDSKSKHVDVYEIVANPAAARRVTLPIVGNFQTQQANIATENAKSAGERAARARAYARQHGNDPAANACAEFEESLRDFKLAEAEYHRAIRDGKPADLAKLEAANDKLVENQRAYDRFWQGATNSAWDQDATLLDDTSVWVDRTTQWVADAKRGAPRSKYLVIAEQPEPTANGAVASASRPAPAGVGDKAGVRVPGGPEEALPPASNNATAAVPAGSRGKKSSEASPPKPESLTRIRPSEIDDFVSVQDQFLDGMAPQITSKKLAHGTYNLSVPGVGGIIYSRRSNTPLAAAEHLSPERVAAADQIERSRAKFQDDLSLPEKAQAVAAYAGYTDRFDHGHMIPAGDSPSQELNTATFRNSNIVPQDIWHNERLWEGIESAVRSMARGGDDLYVVTGPAFRGKTLEAISDDDGHRVLVPTHIWKAVYDNTTGEAAAYWTENAKGSEADRFSSSYEVISIAELAKRTGIDPFPSLTEEQKETAMDLPPPEQPRFFARKHNAESELVEVHNPTK